MINNSICGGFIISKNVLAGVPICYSYREESNETKLNGWNILSNQDNDEYIDNPNNFVIVDSKVMKRISPIMMEIVNAPYGTDLFWVYDNDKHIGFFDLNKESEITKEELLKISK